MTMSREKQNTVVLGKNKTLLDVKIGQTAVIRQIVILNSYHFQSI